MRNSPAAIVIQLLQSATGLVPVVLLWSATGRQRDGWVGVLVDLAFWTYVVLRPASIPLGWLATRWQVDERGIRFRHGVLDREEIDVRWDEVVSFDVSQPYLHRLFGCSAIRFGLGTSQKQAVRLDAVTSATRDRIVALAQQAQLGAPAPVDGVAPAVPVAGAVVAPPSPTPTPTPTEEIYRIRPRDHVLISLTYGSFVLFVPAVLSVLDQVGDWVPLPLPDLAAVRHWSPATQLGTGLAVLVASVAYGWLTTWLRYRGFRVLATPSGYLTSGGLLSRETRTVTTATVTGLKVTQNPLMRALGYGRVSLLTRDAGDQPMANLLFPLVRLRTLPAALGPALPVPAEVLHPTLRVSGPARVSVAAGALLLWAGLLALAHRVQPEWLPATGTALTVLVALLANAAWVVADTVPDRPVCYVRRGLLRVSHVEFATRAVHVVESSRGPFGRLTGTWSVVLHYHDGRVRRVRALGCSPVRQQRLSAPVLGSPALGPPVRA